MAVDASVQIHPTAILSGDLEIGPDVVIGPFAILEGNLKIGAGTVIGPRVHLMGNMLLGEKNVFHTGCIIGDTPQHLGYKGEPTKTIIGDRNIFREGVTVHRGMPTGEHRTLIGSDNLFMVNAHIAHDCVLGSNIIMANGSLLGGHCTVSDRAFLSGNTAVHQFCRIGMLGMIGGTTCMSQDLVPFWICQGRINELHSVNVVGMRRAGFPREEINAARTAYRLLNRSGLTIPAAVAEMEALFPTYQSIRIIIDFISGTKRGIATGHQNEALNEPNY
ncbi:MAG: acyl-ACP--UDP-N-acetylglucosamine O-acyltransferase [Fimbriiglobus sp.]